MASFIIALQRLQNSENILWRIFTSAYKKINRNKNYFLLKQNNLNNIMLIIFEHEYTKYYYNRIQAFFNELTLKNTSSFKLCQIAY